MKRTIIILLACIYVLGCVGLALALGDGNHRKGKYLFRKHCRSCHAENAKGAKQAVQMFGPAQYAVAKAVADCVEDGTIPKDQCDNWVIVCGVFIHWEAEDDKKIFEYNYEATKLSIQRALKDDPSADEMVSKKGGAKHPFSGV